jgi:hypothetical protein
MTNRQVRRRLSEDKMNRGVEMFETGRSQWHVANVLWVSQGVAGCGNEFQMTGNVLQGHAEGRERSTTQAQDRFIVLQARRQRF